MPRKGMHTQKHSELGKAKFIDIWPQVESAFESAVDYLRSFYKIPVSQLLPYDALLVPFTYYFFHHKDIPAGLQQDLLQDYFWRCVLTSRFSSAAETKLTQDVKQIDKILNDEQPVYDVPIDISAEFIRNHGYFLPVRLSLRECFAFLLISNQSRFRIMALFTLRMIG